ncbi:SpoIIE family protein phosphatase, partial [Escherichia coli]|uniref:SpoIIE family protein phosphatase n=1 Tax=Escherichia coli TaxID=562 RepID=UPI0011BA9A3C
LSKHVSVGMQLYEHNEKEVKHKVLENELNILNKQQQLIMDKGKMDCNDEKELYFYHNPARVVGGDFYYATKVDDAHIVYIVADVMGHGMVSNYVVAMIKGAFKVLCNQYNTPREI